MVDCRQHHVVDRGILERIKDIELELSRTQKNKATEHHTGLLKAKLSQLRAQLLEPGPGAGGKGEGFDVEKSGNASVALIGFPSVGKSSFLNYVLSVSGCDGPCVCLIGFDSICFL